MSDRITRADVDRIAETVSHGLREYNYDLETQRRNGYLALDLYRVEYDWARENIVRRAMVDTLHIGTTREVYTYLQGMRKLQLLTGRGAS